MKCADCGSEDVVGRVGGDPLCFECAVTDQVDTLRQAMHFMQAKNPRAFLRDCLGAYKDKRFRAAVARHFELED